VQQPVVGARSTGIEIFLVDENTVDPPQRKISGNAGAGGSSPYDQCLGFQKILFILLMSTVKKRVCS
jgi:hypothetical protein